MHFRKSPPWFRAAFVDLTYMGSPVCGVIYRAVKFCLKSALNNSYFDRCGRNHSKAIHASFKAKRKKKRSKKRKQYSRRTGFWLLFSSTFCILRTRKMQTCACPAKAERSRQDNKEGNYESDSCSGFFPFFFLVLLSNSLHMCTGQPVFLQTATL